MTSAAQPTNVGARTAVVVDDDPALLCLVANWVKAIGLEVESFRDFERAKTRVMREPPDVLITDIRLGSFNGLQLVVLGKAIKPEMATVVLTGFDDPVLQKDAENAGACYLLKPLFAEQLINAIAPSP